MKCSLLHFSIQYDRRLFQKRRTHQLCQNANFVNGGTTIQIGILHVLLNIFSISLLSRVYEMSGYFEMQKE